MLWILPKAYKAASNILFLHPNYALALNCFSVSRFNCFVVMGKLFNLAQGDVIVLNF